MSEKFEFNGEEAGLRAAIVGRLKLDSLSESLENQSAVVELLREWRALREKAIQRGECTSFEVDREEADMYLESDHEYYKQAAIFVLESALIDAKQQGNIMEIINFSDRLNELGVKPEDSDDVHGSD